MTRIQKTCAFAALTLMVGALVALPAAAQTPKQYPQYGTLNYNGAHLVQTDFYWRAIGNWHTSDPALELDMNLYNVDYFDSCTISSNMPSWYDDCGFAGVMDSGYEGFGAGSYKPETAKTYQYYYADWNFSGGSGLSADFKLSWQEMKHTFCWFDATGCMGGACSSGCGGVLKSGRLNWGTSQSVTWNY